MRCAYLLALVLVAGIASSEEAVPVEKKPTESRPERLAVVDFRPYGNQFEWNGQKESTVEWVKSLSDKLTVRLAKTRAFDLLDRKFVAEINDELAGLKDVNADPADIVRKCKRLVTDYLLVGEVRFWPVLRTAANPLTGRAASAGSQLFAEVSYRIVEAPSGRLVHADMFRLDAVSFPVAGLGEFVSQTTDAAAAQVVSGVMSVKGGLSVSEAGAVPAPVPQPVVTMPASTVQGNGTGGVVTPF